MRILSAVALIALLAGPAAAQQQAPVPRYGEPDKEKTPSEIAAEKDAERAYKRSTNSIPEQKAPDPWGAVRSDNTPPPKAAPKPKAGVAKSTAKTDNAVK